MDRSPAVICWLLAAIITTAAVTSTLMRGAW